MNQCNTETGGVYMDFLLLLKKIVLAVVQGIAEILPISSSGHLLIASELLNIDTNGLQLVIFLHFGSLIAMMIYYWKDIKEIIVGLCRFLFLKNREEQTLYYCRLFIMILIASVPAAIVGFALGDIIDRYLGNLYFVFAFLSLTGILLLIGRRFDGEKTLKEIRALDALTIGCFQGIGVLPGISRSGSTIFGGRVRRLSNEEAAHFSFLMFLPVTAGSFLVEIIKEFDAISASDPLDLLSDSIAVILSGIVTYFSVKYLFNIIKKGKLHYFAYYCFALSIIGIAVLLIVGYGF